MSADGADATLRDTLTWRLHRLHKLSDRLTQAAYARDCGLAIGEARCLAALGDMLAAGDRPGVGDLAARANLDKAQASRAAQSLIAQGLVAKSASADDGRSVELALTAAGRARWRQAMATIARRNDEVFGALGEDGRRRLAALLDQAIAAAEAAGAAGEA